ncbi:MAG: methanogen output domain 1-containing protein [Pseudomonadales bacterium]
MSREDAVVPRQIVVRTRLQPGRKFGHLSGNVYARLILRGKCLQIRGPAGRSHPEKEEEPVSGNEDRRLIASLPISLERDVFLRNLIRELSGTLEDVVGVEESSGFISVVGQRVGETINDEYRAALHRSELTASQVAQVLVDLKRRIKGDFYLIEQDGDQIVLGNRACPFGDKVEGRTSLCMMTSNVFGVIAAENLGYCKVVLEETIAAGAAGCRVVVHLRTTAEAEAADGRVYHKG